MGTFRNPDFIGSLNVAVGPVNSDHGATLIVTPFGATHVQ